jgi:hypothetical protein
MLRCPAHMEVALIAIEPWKRIAGAVELWKFKFMDRCGEVPTARAGVVVVVPARCAWRACPTLSIRHIVRLSQSGDGRVQLLLGHLILHYGLEDGDLILERLQGLHLQLDGVQATQDGIEGGVDVAGRTGDGLRTHLGGSETWVF